jgi:hypothetical protein
VVTRARRAPRGRFLATAGLLLLAATASTTAAAPDSPPAPRDDAPQVEAPVVGDAVVEAPADGHAADPDGASPRAKNVPHGDDVASILVLLLGGILMMAVLAFATIIIWGRRMRRALHEAPAKTKPQDELWYLKPKAGLPGGEQGEADKETRRQEDKE